MKWSNSMWWKWTCLKWERGHVVYVPRLRVIIQSNASGGKYFSPTSVTIDTTSASISASILTIKCFGFFVDFQQTSHIYFRELFGYRVSCFQVRKSFQYVILTILFQFLPNLFHGSSLLAHFCVLWASDESPAGGTKRNKRSISPAHCVRCKLTKFGIFRKFGIPYG